MRLIRTVGLALVTTGLLAAVATASASAAVPEVGRCVPSEPRAGEYTGAHCVTPAGGKGRYNWLPGPGAKPKFEGSSASSPVLELPGLKISCAAETFDGEFTGAKTASVTLDLIGCVSGASGKECQSNPAKEGEIEPPGTLEGELGLFTNPNGVRVIGLDVKRSPIITGFTCGAATEIPPELSGTLEGSVIGQISPVNSMKTEFKLKYATAGGNQVPESFEGGEKDTLKAKLMSGLTSTEGPAALKVKLIELTTEEPLELKAK